MGDKVDTDAEFCRIRRAVGGQPMPVAAAQFEGQGRLVSEGGLQGQA